MAWGRFYGDPGLGGWDGRALGLVWAPSHPELLGARGRWGVEKNNSNLPLFAGFPKKWGCAASGCWCPSLRAVPRSPPGALAVLAVPCAALRLNPGAVAAGGEGSAGRAAAPHAQAVVFFLILLKNIVSHPLPLIAQRERASQKPLKWFPLGSLSHLPQLWELPGPRGASPATPQLTAVSRGHLCPPSPGQESENPRPALGTRGCHCPSSAPGAGGAAAVGAPGVQGRGEGCGGLGGLRVPRLGDAALEGTRER